MEVFHTWFLFRFFITSTIIFSAYAPCIWLDIPSSDWCGNKHANLVKLQSSLPVNNNIAIPPFVGISTQRVEKFLRLHKPKIFSQLEQVSNHLQKDSAQVQSNNEECAQKANLGFFKKALYVLLPFLDPEFIAKESTT